MIRDVDEQYVDRVDAKRLCNYPQPVRIRNEKQKGHKLEELLKHLLV